MELDTEKIQDIEIHLLLESLRLGYGYDFRNYSPNAIRRRILHCLESCEFQRISEIIPRLLYEGQFVGRLVSTLTVTVTEMFRDPEVFLLLREKVLPVLCTWPYFNVWHAGCSSGEEVYTMAILLREAGLYDRVQIYATDLNEDALQRAREGIYPLADLKKHTENYQKAGGMEPFSTYYHARYQYFQIDPELRRNIVFSRHNLACDGVFAEMHLILCRNVFIYFNQVLQERVSQLFLNSLVNGGFLCLGSKESLPFQSPVSDQFLAKYSKSRVFQKRALETRQP